MNTFDDALKYLAQRNPGDFIRFALGDPNVDIVKPLPSGLPSRKRDIDGCYLIHASTVASGAPSVAHFEFHRRKQALDELAVDVTEAQIRLFRRERKRVTSFVWDLYGKRDEPFLERRTLAFGAEIRKQCSQGVYLRVNLRAIGWHELLRRAPPVLWPLIALTRDGAHEEAIIGGRDAIRAQKNLGFSEHADYIAILRFVAEAERVPSQLLERLLDQELIMASGYYQGVIEKGKALGEARGEARGEAKSLCATVLRTLERRLGTLNSTVRKKVVAETNLNTLRMWHDMAIDAIDTESAQRLVETIRNTQSA